MSFLKKSCKINGILKSNIFHREKKIKHYKNEVLFVDKDFTEAISVYFKKKQLKELQKKIEVGFEKITLWDLYKDSIFESLKEKLPKPFKDNYEYEKALRDFWEKPNRKNSAKNWMKNMPRNKSTLSKDDIRIIVWDKHRIFKFENATFDRVFK